MKAHDEKLQRLHDGELPEGEAAVLGGQLSPEDREKLLALGEIDGLVRGALVARSGERKLDLWAGIEARLPAERPRAAVPLYRRWGARTTAVVTALAMAAAFVAWLVPGQAPTNHCDVESLEVAGSSATVMKLPGQGGDSMTLIWVDHKESDEWESLD